MSDETSIVETEPKAPKTVEMVGPPGRVIVNESDRPKMLAEGYTDAPAPEPSDEE